MKLIRHFLFLFLSAFVLLGCEPALLDSESIQEIKEISESDSVCVYSKMSDTYIDLYDSRIALTSEQELFYSVIAKAVFDLANKRRQSLDLNGSHVVRFFDSSHALISSYSIRNKLLSKSQRVYKVVYEALRLGHLNEYESLYLLFDEGANADEMIKDKIHLIKESINNLDEPEVNTHGFYFTNDTAVVHVNISNHGSSESFIFYLNSRTYKVLDFFPSK